jgi:2-amino-4-hydroxy-6-hydroxymethyldihydropteridine diphosphokinase
MDQVFITDLVARGIIGVNDWEREKPQEIRINLILFGDLSQAGKSDDIRDTFNYSAIARKVLAHAETARRLTVEALAADLARLCLRRSGGPESEGQGGKTGSSTLFQVRGSRDRTGERNPGVMQPEHPACLLLGSNIQPGKNLALAVDLLQREVKIVRHSSTWETAPVGSAGPDFLNLAVLITTSLEAAELKDRVLRPLEAQLGRVRSADKNAPRTIDIDIIIFNGQLLDLKLWQYAHRAVPVSEILPDFRSDQGEILAEVAARLAKTTLIRLKPDVRIGRQLNAD